MASWQDRIIKTTFRGIPFYWSSITDSGGRRISQHLMPENREIINEDIGKAPESSVVAGYLVGEDYLDQWDTLLAAFKRKGAGEFIHPTLGPLNVRSGTYSNVIDAKVQNMMNFNITFIEDGDNDDTLIDRSNYGFRPSPQDAKWAMYVAGTDALTTTYEADDKLANSVKDAANVYNAGLTKIKDARKVVGAMEGFKRNVFNGIGKGISLKTNVEDVIGSLIKSLDYGSTPERLSQLSPTEISSGFYELVELAQSIENPIYPLGQALQNFQTYSACAASLGYLSQMTFITIEQAETARATLNKIFNELEGRPGATPDTIAAVRDARSAVDLHIDTESVYLAQQKEIAPSSQSNSLAFTYQVYGSLEQEGNVVRDNGIFHPAFLDAGVNLKVIV